MTMRFLKCVAVVSLVHLLAAMMVYGAYHFTKAGNQPEVSGSPSESKDFLLIKNQLETAKEEKPQAQQHHVERGESYWTIARKYNVSLDALLEVNGRSQDRVLRIGETLMIP